MAEAAGRGAQASVFLILRRMRVPLITLILIFSLSVLGLTLIPGQDPSGQPYRLSFFEAFYVMSYTATTIGFGELPYPFTPGQRLWVIISIYLTVIGWAYAIGALLTLLQDRAFRQALALQHFQRKVARLREPFLLLAGYGQTAELLARAFDALGRRLVVLDTSAERIDALDLAGYRSDVPGLVGDAGNPSHLAIAGLGHPYCAGVLALTRDDEVNLAVTMTTTLVRPDLPLAARTVSTDIATRMRAFGTPSVVNPFDRFGNHLTLALRAPASHQLLSWLERGPGAELPERGEPPTSGTWMICGFGRFGRELAADLRAAGLPVTVVERDPVHDHDLDVVVGDASPPELLIGAGLREAVGFVAATDNDTTNLSLVVAARRINPGLFVVARQNRPANAPLFQAMNLDWLFVPSELVVQEMYAELSTPTLWRFLQEMPAMGDAWADDLVHRLAEQCGPRLDAVWKVRLTGHEAPALMEWLAHGDARLGDLLRSPLNRDETLHVVPLLALRGNDATLAPGPDFALAPGDELLFAGRPSGRHGLETTLDVESACEYVLSGQRGPSSWVWRQLTRDRPAARR